MSAPPGGSHPVMASWVTKEQIDTIRAMNDSMKKSSSSSTARPGRGRSSAPSPASTRGPVRARPLTTPPARPSPSSSTSYNCRPSTTTAGSRRTHAPGATRSGAVNAHYGQMYNVGLSTPPAIAKSPQRVRVASPVRINASVSTVVKPKSPAKLRSSILVPGHAQPVVSSAVDVGSGGGDIMSGQIESQSAWVNVPEQSPAFVATTTPQVAGGWNSATPQSTWGATTEQSSALTNPTQATDGWNSVAPQSTWGNGPEQSSAYVAPATATGGWNTSAPQSAWIDAPEHSSAYVAPTPTGGWNTAAPQFAHATDSRFIAAQATQSMTQQPVSFFGGYGQVTSAQVPQLPSAQAATSFAANQSQDHVPEVGRSAGQAVPDTGRVPIATNWTEDDPTKPIIDGHFRQERAEDAVLEIARVYGKPMEEISKDGCSIGGSGARAGVRISSGLAGSIHAPGNASANRAPIRYQADVNSSDWMFAATKPKTNGVPSGDGDVEMSNGIPTTTRSAVPQGPFRWEDLPTLSASKYAPNTTYYDVPKPVPTSNTGKENVKPVNQVHAQGFGVANFGTVNETAKPLHQYQVQAQNFGDVVKNNTVEITKNSGLNVPAVQSSFNPLTPNNAGASTQSAQAPSGFSAAAQHAVGNPFPVHGVQASQNSDVFGAPSAPPAWGSVDLSASKVQAPFGASFAPPAWGSVEHSAFNGDPSFGITQPAVSAQVSQITGFGAPSAPATVPWGSVDLSAPKVQTGVGATRSVAPAANGWDSVEHSATSVQHSQVGGSSNGFGASLPANAGQGTQNSFSMWGARLTAQNPVVMNGSGAATSNSHPVKVSGPGGLDASRMVANIANELQGMFSGKAAVKQPSYEASPFGPPAAQTAPARSTLLSDPAQSSLYQVVPEKKVSGLAASRWS